MTLASCCVAAWWGGVGWEGVLLEQQVCRAVATATPAAQHAAQHQMLMCPLPVLLQGTAMNSLRQMSKAIEADIAALAAQRQQVAAGGPPPPRQQPGRGQPPPAVDPRARELSVVVSGQLFRQAK
jgi:hypothetical protein